MTKLPVVLLCAASGTGLSRVAHELTDEDHPDAIQDLEKRLCNNYVGHKSHMELGLQADEVPSMWHIVRRPREELFLKWKRCFGECTARLMTSRAAPFRVLCMHMSWYNPNTTEFFSPVSVGYIKRAMGSRKCRIEQVIILIDDIYDMYHRLQGPNDIYRPKAIEARAERLHGLHHRGGATTLSTARSSLEAVESALAHLISWRQHEMLHTENLARELGAKFTVLGMKHTKKATTHLLQRNDTPKIYLSHRISEVRRMNKNTSDLPTDRGAWSRIVDEVNELHALFASSRQLLINPTAIDELRFGDMSDDEQRRPLLAARWKIVKPVEDLLWECPTEGYEYTEFLRGGLDLPDPTATSVARSLSNRIYFDISFRDHVIVEHTPGLCVYRPFFKGTMQGYDSESVESLEGVNWSGGVKPEITHWYRKTLFQRDDRRRVAFIHTKPEIDARIAWLRDVDQGEFAETMLSHLPAVLYKYGIPMDDAKSVPDRTREVLKKREPGSHLEQDPDPKFVQLPSSIRNDPDALVLSLEVVYSLATFHSFTLLTRPANARQPPKSVVPIFDVCMLLGNESERGDRLMTDLVLTAEKASRFFAGQFKSECFQCDESFSEDTDDDSVSTLCIGCEETEFWRIHGEAFRRLVGLDAIEFCCTLLALPYEYLKERSDYLQEMTRM